VSSGNEVSGRADGRGGTISSASLDLAKRSEHSFADWNDGSTVLHAHTPYQPIYGQ